MVVLCSITRLFCFVYRSQVFGFSNMHVSFWLSNMLRLNVKSKNPLEFSGKIEWFIEWTRPKNTQRALANVSSSFYVVSRLTHLPSSQSQHFFSSVKTQKQKKNEFIVLTNLLLHFLLFSVCCLLYLLNTKVLCSKVVYFARTEYLKLCQKTVCYINPVWTKLAKTMNSQFSDDSTTSMDVNSTASSSQASTPNSRQSEESDKKNG